MSESERAKKWRQKMKLTVDELADAIGFSKETIYLFEKGFTYDGRDARDRVKKRDLSEERWQRYRMACAGVAAQKETGKPFRW